MCQYFNYQYGNTPTKYEKCSNHEILCIVQCPLLLLYIDSSFADNDNTTWVPFYPPLISLLRLFAMLSWLVLSDLCQRSGHNTSINISSKEPSGHNMTTGALASFYWRQVFQKGVWEVILLANIYQLLICFDRSSLHHHVLLLLSSSTFYTAESLDHSVVVSNQRSFLASEVVDTLFGSV